jgi:hypothetical protein
LQAHSRPRGLNIRKEAAPMTDMQHTGSQRTILVDIDIPFGRLIGIFIKFGLAAIPAAIIVSIIFGIVMAIIFGIIAAIFGTEFMEMLRSYRPPMPT